MNIIHCSSLAYKPVVNKQQVKTDFVQNSDTKNSLAALISPKDQPNTSNLTISSGLDFKHRLTLTGYTDGDFGSQLNKTQTEKALKAYNQCNIQSSRRDLSNSITGIDVYA